MRLLLDTNVLSEVTRPAPVARVLGWLDELDEDRSFISVVSIAEIRRGVSLMDEGRKREALAEWLARDRPQRFEQRVLPVDDAVALAWGDLMGFGKRRSWSIVDGRPDRSHCDCARAHLGNAQYETFRRLGN